LRQLVAGQQFVEFTVLHYGIGINIYVRASSILWRADFHAAPRNSPFAMEFAACHGKMRNCPFFGLLYLIQAFLGSFLILQFL